MNTKLSYFPYFHNNINPIPQFTQTHHRHWCLANLCKAVNRIRSMGTFGRISTPCSSEKNEYVFNFFCILNILSRDLIRLLTKWSKIFLTHFWTPPGHHCKCPSLNSQLNTSALCHKGFHKKMKGEYLEYLHAEKMMAKVEISIWNIWMWRKWDAKFWNP